MRLVTVRTPGGTRAGRLEDGRVTELPFPDVGALLADPAWREAAGTEGGRVHDLEDVELGPPIVRPGKIVCLGLNYETHIRELGREPVDHPTMFAKFADALIGPRDPIVLPRVSEQVDWEVELAFVMGTTVRGADEITGREAIAGYTVLNDISMRDWQWRTGQWLQGKTFDRSTPVGPALVTSDDVGHAEDLAIRCEVDGEVMQDARTSDVVFGPAEIVSYLSTIVTLRPGDLVATGTPGGVGAGRNPPVFLQPGQVVRSSIEGIGELVNVCEPETG
jgi:acylpyruvate hydrolase